MKQENNKQEKIYSPIAIDSEKLLTQKVIMIKGIPIYFPYEPYPPQRLYMEKVILALNKQGSLSALESPTGTGKTLCLLCAILAWVKHYNKKISIYYCTRTVSQINNLLKEFGKTCYKINTSFIASRKHTCLNFPKSEKNKINNEQLKVRCELLVNNIFKKKKLKYELENLIKEYQEKYHNKKEEEELKMKIENLEKEIENLEICNYYRSSEYYKYINKYKFFVDIEDLLKEGKDNFFCPYYYSIMKSKFEANLTIMTYNYILNPYIRRGLNIVEKNSIVILDEAHNICEKFEGYDSNKINTNDLEKIQKLLEILLDFIHKNKEEFYKEYEHMNPIFLINTNDLNDEINKIKKFINNIKKINTYR